MKKKLIILLAISLLLALCSCGTSKKPQNSAEEGAASPFGTSAAPAESAAVTAAAPSEAADITVSFDAGGGSGTMENIVMKAGSDYALPDCQFTAPEDKLFFGWQIDADPVAKPAGATVTFTKDTVLKAIWGTRWAELKSEIDSANSGDVINLTGNVVFDSTDSTLSLKKSLTVDLCGYSIDAKGKGPVFEIKSGELVLEEVLKR